MEQAYTDRPDTANVPTIATSPTLVGLPSAQELMVYETWAKNAAESQMYRSVGKESAIMMIMLAAREYGIGPAQALNGGLHIIEGKVELSARMMSALIRRSKHVMKILESTDKKCVVYGKRSDTGEEHTATFTIEEAQQAGLIKDKGGWKKAPIDMLYARAISRLSRQLFSDVVGIGYVDGEIERVEAKNEFNDQSNERHKTFMIDHDKSLEESLYRQVYNHLGEEGESLEEFIKMVQSHYGWTRLKALNEFNVDLDKTKDKYLTWRKKNVK